MKTRHRQMSHYLPTSHQKMSQIRLMRPRSAHGDHTNLLAIHLTNTRNVVVHAAPSTKTSCIYRCHWNLAIVFVPIQRNRQHAPVEQTDSVGTIDELSVRQGSEIRGTP